MSTTFEDTPLQGLKLVDVRTPVFGDTFEDTPLQGLKQEQLAADKALLDVFEDTPLQGLKRR